MKTALIQMNPTVGALEANTDRIIKKAQEAFADHARLIIFPELTVSGYPPEDLILKDHFTADCEKQFQRLKTKLPAEAFVIVGSPIAEGTNKYNAALVFHAEKNIGTYKKLLLPKYGVFD
jgi:NAD+ synthase (glutamine-hydrolysing)